VVDTAAYTAAGLSPWPRRCGALSWVLHALPGAGCRPLAGWSSRL